MCLMVGWRSGGDPAGFSFVAGQNIPFSAGGSSVSLRIKMS